MSAQDHLLFIHGTISNTISTILQKNNRKDTKSDNKVTSSSKESSQIVREDIYLMPDKPSRAGVAPSVSKFTNEHVLVEFGLQQLLSGLKRSKFSPSDEQHVCMLDPFVEILLQSLTSKHTRLVTMTVRCIALLTRFPLPALNRSMSEIAKQIFKIIKKHARAGASKGDNYEMIMTSFKAMTTIIRDYKDFKVSSKQLQVLLTYVEEDLHDSSRQVRSPFLLFVCLTLWRPLTCTTTKVCHYFFIENV